MSSLPEAPRQTYPQMPAHAPEPGSSVAPGDASPSGAPGPPPGPGVTPPFPAPPVEGRSTRLWVGLGVAALAVTLCCGGGLAAGIGLLVTGTQAVNERAQTVVRGYLDDVRAGRYGEAYDALCPGLRQQESPGQFARRVAEEPRITAYELGDVQLTSGIMLPVRVNYAEGGGDTLRFELEQDSGTGEFEVCGIDG